MKFDKQIYYWAHMLDEGKHMPYYEMYMLENPKDKKDILLETLISEFAACMKKDHVDLKKCIKKGFMNRVHLDELQKSIKHHYYWQKIRADVYKSLISKFIMLLHRSGNQRFIEVDEDDLSDISSHISRNVVEDCLDIICHNINVLEANNDIINLTNNAAKLFKKYGIPQIRRRTLHGTGEVTDYLAAVELYKAWAAYASNESANAVEQYVCDSDYGPSKIRKILEDVEYDADMVDLVVALNKSLDIVHLRSDLASAFIEGGSKTCSMVSNML